MVVDEPAKARDVLLKTKEIDPSVPALYDYLGWAYFKLSSLETADKYYAEYLKLESNFDDSLQHFPVRHRWAYVKWQMGRKEETVRLFKEEIRLDSLKIVHKNVNGVWNNKGNLYDMAGALAFLGRKEEALKWLNFSEREGFFFTLYGFK